MSSLCRSITMRPYRIKSATKMINNVELDGYGVYCNGELRLFVSAFKVRAAQDFVNHINEAFDLFDMQLRNNHELLPNS